MEDTQLDEIKKVICKGCRQHGKTLEQTRSRKEVEQKLVQFNARLYNRENNATAEVLLRLQIQLCQWFLLETDEV